MDNRGVVAQARNDGFSAVMYSVTQVSRLARLNSKIASFRNTTARKPSLLVA